MRHLSLTLPLLLAACSQPDVVAQNASPAEVADKMKAAVKMQPGLYRSQVEVLAFDMPGITDPKIKQTVGDAMRSAQGKPFDYCMTQADVDKPSAEMFGGANASACRYDKFEMTEGRLQGTMTCKSPSGAGEMTTAMTGRYSTTAYDIGADMAMTNPQLPGGRMSMKIRTRAQRTGACKA